ncbi:MAG: DNA polymerase III subunit delta [Lachnospiraceae bacterium]|uniref:DNA polymerase III subunit delta n=1 Tax=Candidatus Weimeria bifida TaxID=2599074 RepID=A0A6N7IZ49_9FIRM|nr:DNA polymerase III subunit delta [Candidatus Weimeria bifida]RRF97033.1 MAG: DNA polymerase III subunit delta [Lachnospiraceae bacterium]
MRSIDSEISQGNFKRVYLLFGKEHYLLKENREKLLAALGVTDRKDMNFTLLTEKDFSVPALISDSDTLPFFADRRVILVEESGYFKGKKSEKEKLVSYIPDIPDTTVIIFVESDVDKRDKLYKAVSKNGTAEEFLIGDQNELSAWIGGRLKADGLQMRRDAWNEFYIRCGSSMDLMDAEYQKLSAYCWDKKQIEKADVEAVCANASETKIFVLSDALSERNAAKVFAVYQDMLRQNEKAPGILALIERQLKQLYQLKVMDRDGVSFNDKKKKLGISYDFIIRKLETYSRRFKESELRELLRSAADYEEAFKSGRIDDSIAVELLLNQTLQ